MTILLGLTPFSGISASGTPAPALVKGSACQLGDIFVSNNGAAVAYVKLYDAATAGAVNVGGGSASTPTLRLQIPAGQTMAISTYGIPFHSGIVYGITGGAADSDQTGVSAAQVLVNFTFL